MKKCNSLALAAFAALVFIPASSLAQGVPVEGSTINGSLVIGRSTFALPPGAWKVVSVSSGNVTAEGSHAGMSDTAIVFVVQLADDGTFIASIWTNVPLGTSRASNWLDATCDRRDTLYRDDFNVNPNVPECLLINHNVRFWVGLPRAEADQRTWDWFQKNSVKRPNTALAVSYRKYFSGDFVSLSVAVNPEYFGQDRSRDTDWVKSEWHPLVIKNDPKRLAFVENFKKWSYVMAENAKATLLDRKPKSPSLPAFDELRVRSP